MIRAHSARAAEPHAKAGGRTAGERSPGRPPDVNHAFDWHDIPRQVRSVLSEAGQPLEPATLQRFEAAFGEDFSSVRIHRDQQAAGSASSLAARAYTVGPHIVFGRGQYAPGTSAGRRLLGHELAHVVQQRRGGPPPAAGRHRGLDAAADQAADEAMRGAPVRVAGASDVAIACKSLFDEFSGGQYSWNFLKAALEHTRPVETILDDLKALSPDQRTQAIADIRQERAARDRAQADLAAKRAAQADPKLQPVFDPMLAEGRRVAERIDAVLIGLGGKAAAATPVPGLNFTPADYSALQAAGKTLTMAPDSGWFPANLQQNLINTLDLVLGPRLWPTATEGVNARDFFHGHLVVKKAKATEPEVKQSTEKVDKWEKDLDAARTAAVGEISYAKNKNLTADKIGAYKKVVEKAEPSLGTLMEQATKIPGAAVMYHTFEFNQPSDARAKGQKIPPTDPRRHYVTPLDTNAPAQYSPPAAGYESEYTIIAPFSFLIDATGAVHVRPMRASSGITTLELSTIAGTEYPIIEPD